MGNYCTARQERLKDYSLVEDSDSSKVKKWYRYVVHSTHMFHYGKEFTAPKLLKKNTLKHQLFWVDFKNILNQSVS